MPPARTDYVQQLRDSFDEIDTLRETPELIKGVALGTLDNALKAVKTGSGHQILQNGRDALANITQKSILEKYKVIYSQMCVLAVSSLETVLKKYFENVANSPANLLTENKKLNQMKLTVQEIIAYDMKFGGKLGRVIIEKDNFSLQDLKSIKTVFEEYFGKRVELSSEEERQACFYLEARHVLVHKGGRVDPKFISSTSIMRANIKNFRLNERITLDQEDWINMQAVFLKIVETLTRRSV